MFASPVRRRWTNFARDWPAGLGESVIQQISDISNPNANEVLIYLPQHGQGNEALDTGKTEILNALHATLGAGEASKQDFNAADADRRGGCAGAQGSAESRAPRRATATSSSRKQLTDYRDHQARGVVANLDDLRQAGATPAVIAALQDSFYASPFAVINVEIVGPKVGSELRRQAVYVTLYALAGMLIYIAFRFEWVYGAAAVLAVFHDVLITLGLFSLLHFEISLTVIAALLTLVGYSMNDTIVIFDRIRENTAADAARAFRDDREPLHQSDAFANHSNEWPDFPNRPGTFPHGRPGVAQFFVCLGGWNSGRNVLKFRYCRAPGRRLESLARSGGGAVSGSAAGDESTGGRSASALGPGRQEVRTDV